MNNTLIKSTSTTREISKTALVAALYVAVTLILAVFSFGVIQLRLSEMFNYLALFHKRYIIGITLGVVIANLLSPTWFLDVPIGGIATFLVLILCRVITQPIHNLALKMAITALIFALSMFTVAGQLTIVHDLPFFNTWLIVGIGELLSMTVGGLTIYLLSKKIDFTK
ncbi:QueT transporter family protein [Kurthia sibirica]|uniref:QueT transporter family protein n=1 Tax=Kurthia sibirica TaxID=202750 RepID=A0A2U3APJ5_9BACL|nr:QueT transporter family protein [Kurthia sibirica]PWI26462.1 hypothetical protein DEX24_03780 [Kurthia sibirica]GEK33030.1 membrane protein [Kurthia sibirica]